MNRSETHIPDNIVEQPGQVLGRKGAQDNPVGKFDSHFFLAGLRGLVDPKQENDLLPRPYHVANVSIRTAHVGVIPANLYRIGLDDDKDV